MRHWDIWIGQGKANPLRWYQDVTDGEVFRRPKMPKMDKTEYAKRVEAFWDVTKDEYSWWCKEYGSAQGAVFFWSLAETQWHWDTLVKGVEWDVDALKWEALLMHSSSGRTDGVWVSDEPVVVAQSYEVPEEPVDERFADKSWIVSTVYAEDGVSCPF
jgi:hypothetical protein